MSRLWPLKPRNYLPPDNSGETFHVLHISDINLNQITKCLLKPIVPKVYVAPLIVEICKIQLPTSMKI